MADPVGATEQVTLVRVVSVTKRFATVVALDKVHLDLRAGEVHVLVGHNGAGKSTLIKVLSGVYLPDEGWLEVGGGTTSFGAPRDAQEAGIATIYQDVNLCPPLSVSDNLILGREPLGRIGALDRDRARRWSRECLDRLGIPVNIDSLVADLSLAQRQMVAIAKATATDARILILDEPTAVLSRPEIATLFKLVAELRASGVGVLYVSHRLAELHEVGDQVTVLRDGRVADSGPLHSRTVEDIVRAMVGSDVERNYPRIARPTTAKNVVVRDLALTPQATTYVSFEAHHGEIVGVAGLVASGKERLAEVLSGTFGNATGHVELEGASVDIGGNAKAIRAGIGYVSADRGGEGLIVERDVVDNMTLVSLRTYCVAGLIRVRRRWSSVRRWIHRLGIRGPGMRRPLRLFSGGNQQKILLGKWLDARSSVLVLVEPTAGLDVTSKFDVYRIIGELAESGVTILLISSDLEELVGLAHRILVMRDGMIAAELPRGVGVADVLYNAVISTGEQRVA